MISKSQTISGVLWKWLERSCSQGVQLIIQIILARLLSPKDFGLIAFIAIFISLSNIIVQGGLNAGLIQKKEVDYLDYTSVFWISIAISFSLYIILFISAPIIAAYINLYQFDLALRALGLVLLSGAVNSVLVAILTKEIEFKQIFYSSLIANIISGIVGISMACFGYGIWSLVCQQIINSILSTVVLWLRVRWRPTLTFSFKRIQILFSFSWKMFASSIIPAITDNIYIFVIGKSYNSEILGFYHRGYQFPSVIINNANVAVSSVLFPTMSYFQEDVNRIKNITRRAVQVSSFLVFPCMGGMIAIADPLVKIILTEKWLPCVPLLQLECLFYATIPLITITLQAQYAIGRSDIRLKLEVIKTLITGISLFWFVSYGITVVVGVKVMISILIVILNSIFCKIYIRYDISEQLHDVLPSLLQASFIGVGIYCIQFLELGDILTLIVQIFTGCIAYLGVAYFLKNQSLVYISSSIKPYLTRK